MLCPIGQSNEKPPLQALAKWWEYVTTDQLDTIDRKRIEIGFIERSKKLKKSCLSCPYFSICRGGCQRNRDLDMASGLYENYFCESYKMFFDACLPLMKEVAAAAQ